MLAHFYYDHDYQINRIKKYGNITFFIFHHLFGSTHSVLFLEKTTVAKLLLHFHINRAMSVFP